MNVDWILDDILKLYRKCNESVGVLFLRNSPYLLVIYISETYLKYSIKKETKKVGVNR